MVSFHLRLFVVALVFALSTVLLPTVGHGQGSTATGLSNELNPSIGASVLILGAYTDTDGHAEEEGDEGHADEHGHAHGEDVTTGLQIQEIEVGLGAVVDPYFEAKLTLASHEVEGIEIEEAFARTLNMPVGLSLRIGKGFLPFGKHNLLHTHSFPFVDGPLIHRALLGDHGLNEVGVELSYLTPLPWFSELTAVVFDPGEESPFVSSDDNDLGYMANWRNLWDLTPSTTVEAGMSFAAANTAPEALDRLVFPFGDPVVHQDDDDDDHDDEHMESAQGGEMEPHADADLQFALLDLTFKHVSTNYRSWDVSFEYLLGQGDSGELGSVDYGGISGYARFQVARRWWLQFRGDMAGVPNLDRVEHEEGEDHDDGEGEHEGELYFPMQDDEEPEEPEFNDDRPWKVSAGVSWVLSEFSALRLQLDHIEHPLEPSENRALLQINYTFGAHPAHSY